MKKIIFSLLFTLLFATASFASEFFPDIRMTGTSGPWMDARSYASLNACVAAVPALTPRMILISDPGILTTGNLTIPSHVTLVLTQYGLIDNTGGHEITFQNPNPIIAPNRRLHLGGGDLDFAVGTIVKSSWFDDLDQALTMLADDTVTLVITESETLTNNCAVPATVTLRWESPFIITSAGDNLTNLKKIEAGTYQIFSGADDNDFDFLAGSVVHSSWFQDLNDAIEFTSNENVDLTILVDQPETIDFDVTVDEYQTLDVKRGCDITIDPGDTLIIEGILNLGGSLTGSGALTCSPTSGIYALGGKIDLDGAISLPSISSPSLYHIFTGTGAITELARVYPEWWGAAYDGATDSTVAIQTALDTIPTLGGGVVIFQGGESHYKITSVLQIPECYGFHLKGSGRSGTAIIQYTNDEAVIEFTDSAHSFIIEGFWLDWETQQTNAHTTSYGIGFNHGDGNSIYWGNIQNIRIDKGFRGIGISGLAGILAVWDMTIRDIVIHDCVGSGIYLASPANTGHPNNRISNIYIDYANVVQFENGIYASEQNGLTLENIDIEQTTGAIISLVTCKGVALRNFHFEHIDYDINGGGLINFVQTSGVIGPGHFESSTLGSGFDVAAGVAFVIRMNSSDTGLYGRVSIIGVTSDISVVAGDSYMVLADANSDVSIENCVGNHITSMYLPLINNSIFNHDGTDVRVIEAVDGDTTPSVARTKTVTLNNTGATLITDFEDGVPGQSLWVVVGAGDVATTIVNNGGAPGSNILTNTLANVLLLPIRTYLFRLTHDGIWYMVMN